MERAQREKAMQDDMPRWEEGNEEQASLNNNKDIGAALNSILNGQKDGKQSDGMLNAKGFEKFL